ncbi:hypothetical protein CNYM01_09565 [Colletotrichum nymphaeae SA-01]|uniref:Uncharacterized protein n=1 Tax=Colletotrichum nymphaeae SA-01 TaxID=1460502 RepID=A0A135SKI8_9PEZI|nr:hypothetical protein CNYM01_09565 [Colletotrichum nymphaeae SA-01]
MSAVSLATGLWTLEPSSEALTRYSYLSAPTYLDGVRSTETLNRISSPHASYLNPPFLKRFAACLLVPHYRLAHANAPLPAVHSGYALTSPPFEPAGWTLELERQIRARLWQSQFGSSSSSAAAEAAEAAECQIL